MKTATAATAKPKIMGQTKKVKTSDLESKVKAKAASKGEAEGKKKKKSKEGKEKGEAPPRASNYNFPKEATNAKDRKHFRTKVRKSMANFKERLAEAKAGKGKEKASTVRKEMEAYIAEVYLNPQEVTAEAE